MKELVGYKLSCTCCMKLKAKKRVQRTKDFHAAIKGWHMLAI
jgi:uncharacterized Fe-S cluster-containing radical SAM superfamily protein